VKSEIPRMITWTQLLEYFGFADRDSIQLGSEDATGNIHIQLIQLPSSKESESIRVEPDSVPLGWQQQKSFFRDHYFGDDRIYYIQYNKCWSREVEEEHGSGASALFMPSFKEFEKQVFRTIRKQKIDKLVFDMRFNRGGNSYQGTKFIEKLSRTKYQGEVKFYVLVSRHTFSSAIINTVDFMNNTDVVIVGEGTGGRPNHFGEIQRFVLPESHLVVSYSTKYFTLLPEDVPSILPDMEASITFAQFMKGIDPALQLIRTHPTD
ncbi:MAG: hypothetical protein KAT15_27125, partial [Bacteroidales bacterium]|nr:hypothetical protein [Bacteroidales bacterium]